MNNIKNPQDDRRGRGPRFSHDSIRDILEFYGDFACVCSSGVITQINSLGLRLLDAGDRSQVVGKEFSEFLAPEFAGATNDLLSLLLEEAESLPAKMVGTSGKEISVKVSVQWARELGPDTVIVKAHDISRQIHLSGDLYRGEERYRGLVDNALDMICSCKDGTVSFINASGVTLLKADRRDQILGLPVSDLFHPDYHQIFDEFIDDLAGEDSTFPAKLACRDGTFIDVHAAVTPIKDKGSKSYMLEVRDISEHRRAVMALHEINMNLEKRVKDRTQALAREIEVRKQAEAKLRETATHDGLTGLPNRNLLMDRIESAMAHARRNQTIVALLFIDLDGFKAVNDTLGHDAGDAVLKRVAEVLLSGVRESDTVARLGGDEFIVALSNATDAEGARGAAEKILQALSEPIRINGEAAKIGGSIGIALYPAHGETAEDLLKKADQAMYAVKESGKNNIIIAAQG